MNTEASQQEHECAAAGKASFSSALVDRVATELPREACVEQSKTEIWSGCGASSEGTELCPELFRHLQSPATHPEIILLDDHFESNTFFE